MNRWQRLRSIVVPAIAMIAISFPLVYVSASPALPAWRQSVPWSTERAKITVDDIVIQAEIADTNALRERGLGYRNGLAQGTGMLFVYTEPGFRSFWMKGMRFCLDIIWIEQGQIAGAAERVCPKEGVPDSELPSYQSPEPVTYVLEMPAGWMASNGLEAGQLVSIEFPESTEVS